jgi:hypothetical protein
LFDTCEQSTSKVLKTILKQLKSEPMMQLGQQIVKSRARSNNMFAQV